MTQNPAEHDALKCSTTQLTGLPFRFTSVGFQGPCGTLVIWISQRFSVTCRRTTDINLELAQCFYSFTVTPRVSLCNVFGWPRGTPFPLGSDEWAET